MRVARSKKPEKKNTSFTTWKIQLENTVNADPKTDGACLQILRAYLDFMGEPGARPYRSLIDLRVATSLSENTIIKRRQKLVGLGYFKADGVTGDGATRYQILNARENIVLDHQTIARETLRRLEAEKKEKVRLRRRNRALSPARREGPLSPSQHEGLNDVWPRTVRGDSPARREGNYVYNSVDAISMEREEYLNGDISVAESDLKISNSDPSRKIGPSQENGYLAAAHGDDDPDAPLPIPESEQEAEEMMDRICDGYRVHPSLRRHLTQMLGIGFLTQAKLQNILGRREGAA
jgi:hypothetical protein